MCGIVGFWGEGDGDVLKAMAEALAHRGPDDFGFHVDGDNRVFLGHRRLVVIDKVGGAQPMWNRKGTIAVVFNGEIYNHMDLRRELTSTGHIFQSHHSDTEVLIHGYEEWGDAGLLSRLQGMFAFAIYDKRTRRLFLARDHLGKKPLFYVAKPGLFAFASEISSLLHHKRVDGAPDRLGLMKFFAYNFFPAPYTPYQDIRKLPAGHFMTVDLTDGRHGIQGYWNFAIEPRDGLQADDEPALAEELRALLTKAVERRLEADVPVGILLSGGVDSSAILALAAQHVQPDQLNTFALGFTESSYDESAFAELMASHVGSRHRHMVCNLEEARGQLAGLMTTLIEPVGDSSILPTWLVCRFAKSHVTVALSGDGGDELFAGYDPFAAIAPSTWYQRLVPRKIHPAIEFLAAFLPVSTANMSFDFKVKRWLAGMGHPDKLWNPIWLAALKPGDIADMFGCQVTVEDLYSEAIDAWDRGTGDRYDRTLEFYTKLYLQDGILVKTDRASMLNGLELRAPFLDLDVVNFARQLPNRFKIRNGDRKVLLKKAVAGLLPESVLHRRKKGFGMPIAAWLRQERPPRPDSAVADVLDVDWLKGRWDAHRDGRTDQRMALWNWMALTHMSDAVDAVRLAGKHQRSTGDLSWESSSSLK